MKEIVINKEFNDLATGDKPVLIDFYADWCGPCQALLPTIEKLADKYEDEVNIVKVNVDRYPQLAQKFSVRSIPALFLLKDQTVVAKAQGYQSESALEKMISDHAGVSIV